LLRATFDTVCRLDLRVFVSFTISDDLALGSACTASASLARISPALNSSGDSGSSDGGSTIARA